MRSWIKQIVGMLLVLALAAGVGGFVLLLRSQQGSLASTMAAANIRSVSPPDGATNVPVTGEIRADYVSRPSQDPVIKFEPPVGVVLTNGHWDGTTYILDYGGLRENSLYHIELDQDQPSPKGEHKQIKVRWSFHTGTSATAPTASPTLPPPSTSASPVPSSNAVPDLVWFYSNTLHGVDWNGKLVKSIKWAGDVQSPDGHFIYDSMTPSVWVYDANGAMVSSSGGGMWADDSQHFCNLARRSNSGPLNLEVDALDGTYKTVGPVQLAGTPGTAPLTPQLVACSPLTGRAVVIGVGQPNEWIWSVELISLTDDSVIYQRRYPNPLARLVASHDGRYIAEQLAGQASSTPYTLIRDLSTGNTAAQLSGVIVSGFSWDGSLVAGATGTPAHLTGAEVVRWQNGKNGQVIWNSCGCPSPFQVRVLAQPEGSKVAVMATDQHEMGTLTIVDANAAAQIVPFSNRWAVPLF